MGTQAGAELDAWLREGGVVVASSDRAARALQAEFHRRRRAEGLSAWPAPQVIDWKTFARAAWEERNLDGQLLLNAIQEQALWSEIIYSQDHLSTALPASVRRLAAMAMEAHELICSYAPELLRDSARVGWDQDAGAFSTWLADFNQRCRSSKLISLSRVPVEMIATLKADASARPPLRLAGFDRLLPIQQTFFDAWGQWQQFRHEDRTEHIEFHAMGDSQTELEACACWCHHHLESNPNSRLLVISQELSQRRGQTERAFLRFEQPGSIPLFEFSLGVPLSQVPLVRSALLLLRWLNGALDENELDWLFAGGLAAAPEESAALQACMRTLRRRDLQRVQWTLEAFLTQAPVSSLVPSLWKRRMLEAHRRLRESIHPRNPIEWSDEVPHLLETSGWPASQTLSSVGFQAQRRWQQALDTVGSLGFDGRRLSWRDFLAELEHAAEEVLFAPQSTDAPIQIAGPAESAGLTADAIWFLGADEDSWPAVASMHPFLPPYAQRKSGMPHASPLQDWEFGETITDRLLSSASHVHFSFALQKEDVETRPSRMIRDIAGAPVTSSGLLPPPHEPSIAVPFEDFNGPTFPLGPLRGGAGVLSSQSQCAFKAFATARLAAQNWDPAEAGLSPRQRGQILHAVLHSVWSGRRPGIKNHDELIAINDLPAFVRKHVKATFQSELPAGIHDQMPPLYLDLEETRLIRLVTEWFEYERTRLPFTVEETEARRSITIAGLTINLRLDRVDRLIDGSPLVIDYKTGNVAPKSWDLPRPDDVQLPLYKLFGLEPLQPSLFESYGGPASGGLVFAKVRTGHPSFTGCVADARATIDPSLNGNNTLVKRKLTAADESEWKQYIEQLIEDFIHGRAEVDPRDYPNTCKHCGLQSVCRIQEPENRIGFDEDTEGDDEAEE